MERIEVEVVSSQEDSVPIRKVSAAEKKSSELQFLVFIKRICFILRVCVCGSVRIWRPSGLTTCDKPVI